MSLSVIVGVVGIIRIQQNLIFVEEIIKNLTDYSWFNKITLGFEYP